MARHEYEGLETLRRYNLIGSPHHVVRPLGFDRDINGVLAVEYYAGEEFSHAIDRATHHGDDAHLYWRLKALAYFPRHATRPHGQWRRHRLRCRLRVLRHGCRQAQEDAPR
jgi:hypothetical protein